MLCVRFRVFTHSQSITGSGNRARLTLLARQCVAPATMRTRIKPRLSNTRLGDTAKSARLGAGLAYYAMQHTNNNLPLQNLCFARVKVAHPSRECATSRTAGSVSSESKGILHTVATVLDRQDPQK